MAPRKGPAPPNIQAMIESLGLNTTMFQAKIDETPASSFARKLTKVEAEARSIAPAAWNAEQERQKAVALRKATREKSRMFNQLRDGFTDLLEAMSLAKRKRQEWIKDAFQTLKNAMSVMEVEAKNWEGTRFDLWEEEMEKIWADFQEGLLKE